MISIIGLGYVGMPLAVAFSEKGQKIIGFDTNQEKVELYRNGIDSTNEIGNIRLSMAKNIVFTSNESDLDESNFYIVAVPTPVGEDKVPNLGPVIGATQTVARHLKKGDYVVFESTVYPGATEDVCVPLLEEISGLKFKIDFKVGYSPERINPGDHIHRLETIVKVVSGCDEESLGKIAKTYETIIDAGVYRATSIKVAEASKVIENTQRDLNIALMNELSMIFDRMNINTLEVLEAAGTKWNFLKFTPGLVGGHCIGVDPYYLISKSQKLGYYPELISAARRINDSMGSYIGNQTVLQMVKNNIKVNGARALVMGLTFKENCPDLRNSRVIDVIRELEKYGVTVTVTDPIANHKDALEEYAVSIANLSVINNIDVIVIAVAHQEYKIMNKETFSKLLNKGNKKLIIDVKSIIDTKIFHDFVVWKL